MYKNSTQTVYLLKEEQIQLYDEIYHNESYILPTIHSHFLDSLFFRGALRDLYFMLYMSDNRLILLPQSIFIYPMKTTLFQLIMKTKAVIKLKYKTEGNAIASFFCATQLVNFIEVCMENFKNSSEENHKTSVFLMRFAHKNIELLFDANFQRIEEYPRDLAVAQARAVQYFVAEFNKQNEQIEKIIENICKEGYGMYEALYKTTVYK